MKYNDHDVLPNRILGMQRIENLFKQNGYLICQSTGKKIYNFNEIVVIFLPLSLTGDQVMAVHRDHAKSFLNKCLSLIFK